MRRTKINRFISGDPFNFGIGGMDFGIQLVRGHKIAAAMGEAMIANNMPLPVDRLDEPGKLPGLLSQDEKVAGQPVSLQQLENAWGIFRVWTIIEGKHHLLPELVTVPDNWIQKNAQKIPIQVMIKNITAMTVNRRAGRLRLRQIGGLSSDTIG